MLDFIDMVLVALYEGCLLCQQQIIYFLLEVIAKTVELRERADYFKEGFLGYEGGTRYVLVLRVGIWVRSRLRMSCSSGGSS